MTASALKVAARTRPAAASTGGVLHPVPGRRVLRVWASTVAHQDERSLRCGQRQLGFFPGPERRSGCRGCTRRRGPWRGHPASVSLSGSGSSGYPPAGWTLARISYANENALTGGGPSSRCPNETGPSTVSRHLGSRTHRAVHEGWVTLHCDVEETVVTWRTESRGEYSFAAVSSFTSTWRSVTRARSSGAGGAAPPAPEGRAGPEHPERPARRRPAPAGATSVGSGDGHLS